MENFFSNRINKIVELFRAYILFRKGKKANSKNGINWMEVENFNPYEQNFRTLTQY